MRARWRALLILMLLAATMGCDRSLPTPTPTPAPPDVPTAVVAARDAVLAYLSVRYPSVTPASGMLWQGRTLTPSSVAGVSYYELAAGQWRMMVNVPLIAAHRYLFEIELRNEEQGIDWSGVLNENLVIRESNLNVTPGARLARDTILAHLREQSPSESPPDSLVWAGERTTPTGSDEEYCSFAAPDWTLYLVFGPSQPDQTVYLGELYTGHNSLVWRGQVEPEGSVVEILR